MDNTMPVPSLYELARKACTKNIKSITDVAAIPYKMVRPVLMAIENPEQLKVIENASPQICAHDKEIWLKFIKRDIPSWEEKLKDFPEDASLDWSKVYQYLIKEIEAEDEEAAQALCATLQGIKTKQAENTIKHVHPSTVPKLPKMGMMIYATSLPHFKKQKKPKVVLLPNYTHLTFGAGSKTKVLTGKGVMDKARKEARQLSLFQSEKSVLAIPTHKLNNAASQIMRVPPPVVEERKKTVVSFARPAWELELEETFVVKRKIATPLNSRVLTAEEQEQRLLALSRPAALIQTSSPSIPSPPPTTSDRDQTPPTSTGTIDSTSLDRARPQNTSTKSSNNPTLPRMPKAPRLSISPDNKGKRGPMILKKRAPVDPFMPAKRRRIASSW